MLAPLLFDKSRYGLVDVGASKHGQKVSTVVALFDCRAEAWHRQVNIIGNVLCARLSIKVEQRVHDDSPFEVTAVLNITELIRNKVLVDKVFAPNGSLKTINCFTYFSLSLQNMFSYQFLLIECHKNDAVGRLAMLKQSHHLQHDANARAVVIQTAGIFDCVVVGADD